jgi:hypothetical protein
VYQICDITELGFHLHYQSQQHLQRLDENVSKLFPFVGGWDWLATSISEKKYFKAEKKLSKHFLLLNGNKMVLFYKNALFWPILKHVLFYYVKQY